MKQIESYLNCRECNKEKPKSISMHDYCSIVVGKTPHGIQVWCKRHDKEIAHFYINLAALGSCACEGCKTKGKL